MSQTLSTIECLLCRLRLRLKVFVGFIRVSFIYLCRELIWSQYELNAMPKIDVAFACRSLSLSRRVDEPQI